MRPLITLSLLLLCQSLLANPIVPNGTFTYDKVRDGTQMFPAAICPEINRRYEEISDQLDALKDSVRKDTNCKDDEAKVTHLDDVVKGRDDFWNTINKGRGQALTKEESDKVTGYVEKVVKSGAAVTDLVVGSSCFKDDRKNQISVSLVASLVSESTAALATVTGPYGPLVGLGGKLTSSLLTSLDTVVRSRQAYDFGKAEQRKTFMKVVCSYHGFRRELDDVTRTDRAIADMTRLEKALDAQLHAMVDACPECKEIAQRYDRDFKAGEDYVRSPMAEIAKRFDEQVKRADERFFFALGTQTIINLRSFVWTRDELVRLDHLISDIGDVERDRVVEIQDTIEDFLFVKWMPVFVRHYQDELEERLSRLHQKLTGDLFRLGEADYTKDDDTAGLVQRLFAPAPTTLPAITLPPMPSLVQIYPPSYDNRTFPNTFKTIRDRDAFRQSSQTQVNRLVADVVSALLVIEKTCTFVRASQSRYEAGLHRACDSQPAELLDRTYTLLAQIFRSTHAQSSVVRAAFEVPSPALLTWAEKNAYRLPTVQRWSATWIESLGISIEELLKEKDFYFRLK